MLRTHCLADWLREWLAERKAWRERTSIPAASETPVLTGRATLVTTQLSSSLSGMAQRGLRGAKHFPRALTVFANIVGDLS